MFQNREDLDGLRTSTGAGLFRFYRDLIKLRLAHDAIRGHDIDVVYTDNAHRLIAFRRWSATGEFLVLGSLNNRPFDAPGYRFVSPGIHRGAWREIFNSDAHTYGGAGVGNAGASILAADGSFTCVMPANGILVFQREG